MTDHSTPSSVNLRANMHRHIQRHCLLTGREFDLSAGSRSSFYFDCKKATLNGAFLNWLAEYVLKTTVPTLDEIPTMVGGRTLGADFMTAALVMKAAELSLDIKNGSIVRKEKKKHGTQAIIENELQEGIRRILVVDDVITSGDSIGTACDEFRQVGYEPIAMLTIVDREEGGVPALQERFDLPIISIFTSSDFTLPQVGI